MSWLYQPLLPASAQLQAGGGGGGISPAVAFHHLRRAKQADMHYLRQATASQAVLIGPFVDSTDGVTAETGLTIANTDIRLSANGGNMAAKNSGGGTHDEIGYYTITLDATDTATVGRLQLSVAATGALPVCHEFQVLEEGVYDGIFAASAGALATAAALSTVDGNVDSILVDTDTTIPGLIAALNNLSASQVNDEVVDALATDTYAEETGVPPATDTLAGKISRLHMALRNRVDVTATKKTFYDDAGNPEWEQDVSDDGTTYSQSEANAI